MSNPDRLKAYQTKTENDGVPMHLLKGSKDVLHYGVKGMQWGVRRSSSELRRAAKERKASSGDKKDSKPESSSSGSKKTGGDIQDRVESSAERYNRLATEAKAGRASDMTDQDLKFFNARTEALAKINKLNEEQPSWLKKTATEVVQNSAKKTMQNVSDSLVDKYIGGPITGAIKGAKS